MEVGEYGSNGSSRSSTDGKDSTTIIINANQKCFALRLGSGTGPLDRGVTLLAKGEIPVGERAATRYYHTTITLLLPY